MGKYDEDYRVLDADLIENASTRSTVYFLYKIANELAEANRLRRQRLTMTPGDWIPQKDCLDKC